MTFCLDHIFHGRPENSSHYDDKIFVGYIRRGNVKIIRTELQRAFVDNDTVEWVCQDYVLDLLDISEEYFIMDSQYDQYRYTRDELVDKRGQSI
jgi:hypothetical protein